MTKDHGSSPVGDTHRVAETAVVSSHTPGLREGDTVSIYPHPTIPGAEMCTITRELARDRWPELRVSEVESMRRDANSAAGYREAFYEMAALMGLAAMPDSPAVVWRTVMKPRLEAAISKAHGQ